MFPPCSGTRSLTQRSQQPLAFYSSAPKSHAHYAGAARTGLRGHSVASTYQVVCERSVPVRGIFITLVLSGSKVGRIIMGLRGCGAPCSSGRFCCVSIHSMFNSSRAPGRGAHVATSVLLDGSPFIKYRLGNFYFNRRPHRGLLGVFRLPGACSDFAKDFCSEECALSFPPAPVSVEGGADRTCPGSAGFLVLPRLRLFGESRAYYCTAHCVIVTASASSMDSSYYILRVCDPFVLTGIPWACRALFPVRALQRLSRAHLSRGSPKELSYPH